MAGVTPTPLIPPPASPLPWRVKRSPGDAMWISILNASGGLIVAECANEADAAYIVAVANAHAAAGKERA